jgi:hypothetical protein
MKIDNALGILPNHAVNDTELTWLAMKAMQANTIIEIGSYLGRSTRALGDNTPGIVYAVDPWTWRGAVKLGAEGPDGHMTQTAKDDVWNAFRTNLADLIDSGKVLPCRMTSKHFYQSECCVKPGHPFVRADLIFIDGNHQYADVSWEIEHYRTLLTPGGIICGHDYDWPSIGCGQPGVTKAVNEAFRGAISHCDSIWCWQQPVV